MNETWTEDEDFYLSQGYAIYHDEKTDIWPKILKLFPFKPSRVASDLQDRWRDLQDKLETEDQGALDRIKDASKYHSQTWTYNYEPTIQTPDPNQIIEQFRSLPSLAMKTQLIELHSSRFTHDNQNNNEMCLNHQFEASSIRKIVQDVLNKTVDKDDEALRTTLMNGFKSVLSHKGREFAYEDIERKIRIINEMTDNQTIDTEISILLEYFDKVFSGMLNRLNYANTMENYEKSRNLQKQPNLLTNVLRDVFSILKMLYIKVKPPPNAKPIIESFYRDFLNKFYQTYGKIFNSYMVFQKTDSFNNLLYNVYEFLIAEDKNHEIDKYLDKSLQQNLYFIHYREKKESTLYR
ncbi:hypothetical protein M9Y10_044216 [Tritrichomonas musculus]|uniref:Myb-like domain-containing protein n=1 Tax=Tritrichomonas musculus TaxID=1915356 RepID=A0ABR2K2C4_9EUKA